MIQSLKQNFAVIFAAAVLALTAFALPMTVHADDTINPNQEVNCGTGGDDNGASLLGNDGSGCATSGDNQENVESVIRTVINVFSAVVGAVSVIMIILGGFKYITSGGDSNNVSGAKNTILYAIVGLVIVAFAQIIVQFVLERSSVQ